MEDVGGGNPNHTPQPVWAWNEFNHLDIDRRPYSYPDWTHTNAVIYSKDDGNLIISMRHQNWLVKIDYNNGAGAGNILWDKSCRRGNFHRYDSGGYRKFQAAECRRHARHMLQLHRLVLRPAWPFPITTTNTTGQFGLVLFDNGDDRAVVDVPGGHCGSGQPVACYSTVPLFTIDETAMTATLASNPTTPNYSYFGGNA